MKNIGSSEGAEVPQVYIGYENSKIDRPIKELKGFAKVNLLPNESKNVSINVNFKDLQYYDTTNNIWRLENILYNVYVGASSKNIKLKGKFNIK